VRICTIDEIRPGLDAVIFNNRAVGRLLGRFLFTPASHKQVMIFRRYTYAYPEYEREEGLREIMTEMQVPHTRVQWFSHCGWPGTPKLVDRFTDFFSGGMRIDAVYLHAPHFKEEILEAARRAAVAPPLIASVGSQEELQKQGMAGVAFRLEELGERAAELAMARLNKPSAPLRTVQLEGKLYVPDNAPQR
jgi:DNA-binding LacI/PurR family transcriptional regulator